MTPLERAAQAVGVRPMLWTKLSEFQEKVLRGRIAGQAYTAIGQTIGGKPMAGALVKQAEDLTIKMVLHEEKIAIQLDRIGQGGRWARRK